MSEIVGKLTLEVEIEGYSKDKSVNSDANRTR